MYKLIIVDDESLVLEYLSNFIKKETSKINVVATFDSGADALDYLKNNPVDIVLTDISMPLPNGLAIAEFCHNSLPDTLVIFLSAYQEFEYAHSAITLNVHDYILKPISKALFLKSLNSAVEILDKRNQATSFSIFASNEHILLCQEIFSDLVCRCISDVSALEEKLTSIGLDASTVENSGITFNLYIKDLTDYLENIWKHGKSALFDTLLRLFCQETDIVFFAPIWYTQNKFEIIGISKKENITKEQIISEFESLIQKELSELLKLNTKISVTQEFTSVASMITDSEDTQVDGDLSKKFLEYIEQNYKNHINLEDMARHFNFSRVYFSVYYKKCIGESFSTTLSKVRINKAKELLLMPNAKISSVMHQVGYNHSTHFHKTFKNLVGCSPAEYQKNNAKK